MTTRPIEPVPAVAPRANPLVSGPLLPTLLKLSAPNVVAMVAQAAVAIADTAYAGWLGTPELAGFALVFPLVMLSQMMSAGAMGGGISSAVARAIGAGDMVRAQRLAQHAVVIGAGAGVATTVLMLGLGPALYRLLGGRGAALEQALLYSNVVFLGAIGIWLMNTLASILRGTGNMHVPSSVLLVGALAQIVLAGALGLGWGPLPRLGMVGIALGQVITAVVSAVVFLRVLTRRDAKVRLEFGDMALDGAMFRDILKVGAIAIISPVQSVLTVLILTRLVAQLGTEAIAGYGIGARLEFMLVPIVFAVGVAAVPMVGMAIGAGDVGRARRVAWAAGLVAAAVTGVIGCSVALVPDAWARLFSSDPRVLEAARLYLHAAGPAYAFYGFGLATYFASQGSGKILGPVLAQSVRLVVIAGGGWWLAQWSGAMEAGHGPGAREMFLLVGAAMVAYGLASAVSLTTARWGRR